MEIAIGWVVFAIIVSVAANSRGRDGVGWFLLACIISPVLAFLLLVAMPSRGGDPTWMERHEGKAKQCPFCAEYIQPKAIVCKHCGRDLIEESPKTTPIPPIEPQILIEPQISAAPETSGSAPSISSVAVWCLSIIGVAVIFIAFTSSTNPKSSSGDASVSTSSPQAQAGVVVQAIEHPKKPDHAAVAAMPCRNLVNAYGTTQFEKISGPLIETISAREGGLGRGVDIISFIATECRLHEKITIGQAVENLFDQKRGNRLPQIPIGGATSDPKIQASRDAFDRWIRHQGPRPDFDRLEPRK